MIICKKCDMKIPDDAETAAYLGDYIKNLPQNIRAGEKLFSERSEICAECDKLIGFTCALCGCFASARCAKKGSSCPDKKW